MDQKNVAGPSANDLQDFADCLGAIFSLAYSLCYFFFPDSFFIFLSSFPAFPDSAAFSSSLFLSFSLTILLFVFEEKNDWKRKRKTHSGLMMRVDIWTIEGSNDE